MKGELVVKKQNWKLALLLVASMLANLLCGIPVWAAGEHPFFDREMDYMIVNRASGLVLQGSANEDGTAPIVEEVTLALR